MKNKEIQNLIDLWTQYEEYRFNWNLKWNKENEGWKRDVNNDGMTFRDFIHWLETKKKPKDPNPPSTKNRKDTEG